MKPKRFYAYPRGGGLCRQTILPDRELPGYQPTRAWTIWKNQIANHFSGGHYAFREMLNRPIWYACECATPEWNSYFNGEPARVSPHGLVTSRYTGHAKADDIISKLVSSCVITKVPPVSVPAKCNPTIEDVFDYLFNNGHPLTWIPAAIAVAVKHAINRGCRPCNIIICLYNMWKEISPRHDFRFNYYTKQQLKFYSKALHTLGTFPALQVPDSFTIVDACDLSNVKLPFIGWAVDTISNAISCPSYAYRGHSNLNMIANMMKLKHEYNVRPGPLMRFTVGDKIVEQNTEIVYTDYIKYILAVSDMSFIHSRVQDSVTYMDNVTSLTRMISRWGNKAQMTDDTEKRVAQLGYAVPTNEQLVSFVVAMYHHTTMIDARSYFRAMLADRVQAEGTYYISPRPVAKNTYDGTTAIKLQMRNEEEWSKPKNMFRCRQLIDPHIDGFFFPPLNEPEIDSSSIVSGLQKRLYGDKNPMVEGEHVEPLTDEERLEAARFILNNCSVFNDKSFIMESEVIEKCEEHASKRFKNKKDFDEYMGGVLDAHQCVTIKNGNNIHFFVKAEGYEEEKKPIRYIACPAKDFRGYSHYACMEAQKILFENNPHSVKGLTRDQMLQRLAETFHGPVLQQDVSQFEKNITRGMLKLEALVNLNISDHKYDNQLYNYYAAMISSVYCDSTYFDTIVQPMRMSGSDTTSEGNWICNCAFVYTILKRCGYTLRWNDAFIIEGDDCMLDRTIIDKCVYKNKTGIDAYTACAADMYLPITFDEYGSVAQSNFLGCHMEMEGNKLVASPADDTTFARKLLYTYDAEPTNVHDTAILRCKIISYLMMYAGSRVNDFLLDLLKQCSIPTEHHLAVVLSSNGVRTSRKFFWLKPEDVQETFTSLCEKYGWSYNGMKPEFEQVEWHGDIITLDPIKVPAVPPVVVAESATAPESSHQVKAIAKPAQPKPKVDASLNINRPYTLSSMFEAYNNSSCHAEIVAPKGALLSLPQAQHAPLATMLAAFPDLEKLYKPHSNKFIDTNPYMEAFVANTPQATRHHCTSYSPSDYSEFDAGGQGLCLYNAFAYNAANALCVPYDKIFFHLIQWGLCREDALYYHNLPPIFRQVVIHDDDKDYTECYMFDNPLIEGRTTLKVRGGHCYAMIPHMVYEADMHGMERPKDLDNTENNIDEIRRELNLLNTRNAQLESYINTSESDDDTCIGDVFIPLSDSENEQGNEVADVEVPHGVTRSYIIPLAAWIILIFSMNILVAHTATYTVFSLINTYVGLNMQLVMPPVITIVVATLLAIALFPLTRVKWKWYLISLFVGVVAIRYFILTLVLLSLYHSIVKYIRRIFRI